MPYESRQATVSRASVCLLIAGVLFVAGCAKDGSLEATHSAPPVLTVALGSTATRQAAPSPTASPVELTVLHTNDNWGETEPCG